MMSKQIIHAFVTWARSRGLKKPSTKDGMDVMFAQFLAEQPYWSEVAEPARDQTTPRIEWNGVFSEIRDPLRVGQSRENDDFQALVEDREQAMAEGHGEDLARDAILTEKIREEHGLKAPWVRTNPASALKASLGSQLVVQAGGPVVEVARWIGDDLECHPISIDAGYVEPFNAALGTALRPFGRLQFGTTGYAQSVDFDITRGVQFSVSCAYAVLSVGILGNVAGSMTLFGFLSFGLGRKNNPVYRTIVFDSLNGTSAVTAIPNMAKTLALYRTDATQHMEIAVLDPTQTAMYTIDRPAGAGAAQETVMTPIPLANEAAFFKIINLGSATSCWSIFELGI
jgi:hypothetical protein